MPQNSPIGEVFISSIRPPRKGDLFISSKGKVRQAINNVAKHDRVIVTVTIFQEKDKYDTASC